MSGYTSWAAMAAEKAKTQRSAPRTNNKTNNIATLADNAGISANDVANLASGFSNMTVTGSLHPNGNPGTSLQLPTVQPATTSNGRVRGGRARGCGGNQHPGSQPHALPNPHQAQPAPAWGLNSSSQHARPQSDRGDRGSASQHRVVHILSSQAQVATAMGMNLTPNVYKQTNQAQSRHGDRGGAKSRGNKPVPVQLGSAVRSVRGTTFHPFPHLPVELRLKIWKMYLDEDRLIEIERGPKLNYEETDPEAFLDHGARRVSPRSRLPPTILQINKEVRAEFLKVYQRVCFDSGTRNHQECALYFNPAYDILFFGQNACITSIIHIFQMAHRKEIDIPRIAINASGKMTECCDWIAEDDYAINRNCGVWNGCNLPQALHGISAKVNNEKKPTITRGRGLTNVFFVQPSMFWGLPPGAIDASVGFRLAVGDGITNGQKRIKENMNRMIKDVENEVRLRGVGEEEGDNKWVGDKKPNFSFVSMIPKLGGDDKRVYDSVVVKVDEFFQLNQGHHRGVINAASFEHKCVITWCKSDFKGQAEREIGLLGMAEDNEKIKAIIQGRLVKMKEVVETTEG